MDFEEKWRIADDLRDVVPILTLSEDERREIVSHLRVRRFDEDEVIYHQGDPGHDLFVVHTGLVMSAMEDDQGGRLLLDVYGRGQFFGELELFKTRPGRLTTVTAARPTTALQIRRDDAVRVLEQNPKAMSFMGRRIFELYNRLMSTMAGLVFMETPSRVADVLDWLEGFSEAGKPLAMTREEIASAAGISERTLQRTLAGFAKRGLIRVEPRRIHILQRARLRAEVKASLPEENREEFERRERDVFFRDA